MFWSKREREMKVKCGKNSRDKLVFVHGNMYERRMDGVQIGAQQFVVFFRELFAHVRSFQRDSCRRRRDIIHLECNNRCKCESLLLYLMVFWQVVHK